jgi:hypothetical protein
MASGATQPGRPPEPESPDPPDDTCADGPPARSVDAPLDGSCVGAVCCADSAWWCFLGPDEAAPVGEGGADVVADGAGDVVPCAGCAEGDAEAGCRLGCGLGGGLGWRLGCGDGDGEVCTFGFTLGGAWAWPCCQDSATDPPSGTCSDSTPTEAYFHEADFPSDHHSDQYAVAGGVRTHWVSGVPST